MQRRSDDAKRPLKQCSDDRTRRWSGPSEHHGEINRVILTLVGLLSGRRIDLREEPLWVASILACPRHLGSVTASEFYMR
jgi:hypothetical protein